MKGFKINPVIIIEDNINGIPYDVRIPKYWNMCYNVMNPKYK